MQLQNRLEALLEEAHIKISSLVSDLLGVSARRMLKAIAEGQTDPATVVALADERLQATPEQLRGALGVCRELNPLYRRLIRMALEEVASIDKRIEQLDQEMADLLRRHEDQVQRLAEVPGLFPAATGSHTARTLFPPSGSSLNQLSGPIQNNLNLRRTNVRFLDTKEMLTIGQDRVIMSGL